MDKEEVRLIIADYKLDYESLPEYSYRTRKKFVVYSYVKWACDELLGYIFDHWDALDPIDATVEFRHKMYACKNLAERGSSRHIFSIAVDVADDIEDLFSSILVNRNAKELDERYEFLISDERKENA